MIVQAPNQVLFQKAKQVGKIDKRIAKIIAEMKRTLTETRNPKGVGLAAPQIGISLRIFVMRPRTKDPVTTVINPQVVWQSEEKDIIKRYKSDKKTIKDDKRLEGCLSLDNIWGHVRRSVKLKLRYQDIKGLEKETDFADFEATIIQHEVDHLNGILFTTRALEQNEKLYKIEKADDGKEKLVEIEI